MNLWPLSRVEVRSCQRLYHLYWFSRNDLHIRILQSLLPCFAHTQFIESAESGQISSQCCNGWSCLALGLALGYEPAVQKHHNPSGLTAVPQAKKLNNSQAFSLVLYMYIELFWGGNAQIRQWVGTGHGYRGCVTLNGGKIEESSTVNKISHFCRLWQEPEWKRMRTPSPESGPWVQHCRIYTLPSLAVLRPGNRSYELPEADSCPIKSWGCEGERLLLRHVGTKLNTWKSRSGWTSFHEHVNNLGNVQVRHVCFEFRTSLRLWDFRIENWEEVFTLQFWFVPCRSYIVFTCFYNMER